MSTESSNLKPDHGAAEPSCGPGSRPGILAALLIGIALSLLPLVPPLALEDGESGGFSTERALSDLEELAQNPRPIGSAEHRRVRGFLQRSLRQAGFSTEIQEKVVVRPRDGDSADLYWARNVHGLLPGTSSGSSLLLVAHYDSVPSSPGAADNGAAVAALLETARVLGDGGSLRRPVEILFSDAEETGLAGMRAYVSDPARADRVGLALNFEARGTGGPSILFETAGADLALVRHFQTVARGPLALSLSRDVYRLMPNTTDFEVLRSAGVPGMNFAFIEGVTGYHSPLDRVEQLDARSLSHHGAHALALARHFDDVDMEALATGIPGSYFPVPLAGVVAYPVGWNLGLAVLLLLAGIGLTATVSRRSGPASRVVAGVGRTLVAVPLALLAAAVVAFGFHFVLGLLGLSAAELLGVGLHAATLGLLVLAVAVWVTLRLARGVRRDTLAAGSTLAWGVLAVLASVLLPSSAYLFVWPGLLLAAGVGLSLALGGRGFCAAVALAGLPIALLWFPALVLLATAASPSVMWLVAALAALPVAGCTVQLAVLLDGLRPALVPAVFAVVALVMAGVLFSRAGHGPERPVRDSLLYVQDSAEGVTSRWLSFDPVPDAWTGSYLGDGREPVIDVFEGSERQMLAGSAPRLDLPPPTAELVSEEATTEGGRRLRLELGSPRGAGILRLALRSDDPLPKLRVAGREVPLEQGQADGERSAVLWGLDGGSVPVEVEVAGDAELRLTTVDMGYGLPRGPEGEELVTPRLEGFAPRSDAPTDVTLVRSTHVF